MTQRKKLVSVAREFQRWHSQIPALKMGLVKAYEEDYEELNDGPIRKHDERRGVILNSCEWL